MEDPSFESFLGENCKENVVKLYRYCCTYCPTCTKIYCLIAPLKFDNGIGGKLLGFAGKRLNF